MENLKHKCPMCKRTKLLNEKNFVPINEHEGAFYSICRLCLEQNENLKRHLQ